MRPWLAFRSFSDATTACNVKWPPTTFMKFHLVKDTQHLLGIATLLSQHAFLDGHLACLRTMGDLICTACSASPSQADEKEFGATPVFVTYCVQPTGKAGGAAIVENGDVRCDHGIPAALERSTGSRREPGELPQGCPDSILHAL